MNATASPAALAISPAGPVAGTAWLAPSPGGVEMHVIGKLVLQLGHAGATSFVSKPELPGWNQGRGAKEEVEVSDARKLIVRGHRTQPGKLILRRGTTAIGEIPFGPGVDTVTMPLSSTMQATIAGKGGDDWLVVEGVEGPQARRWCKLPKLGIVACWDEIERMLLTSRVCLVDVSSWTIAFVVRASRKLLPAMAPRVVTLSVLDLAQGPGAQETPSPQHASGTYVAAREPAPPAKLTPPKPIPSGAALLGGDGPPTMVSSGVELPVPKPQPSTAGTAGSKLGRTRQLQPEEVQQLLARSQDAERPIGGPMVAGPMVGSSMVGGRAALDDGADEAPTRMLPNADLLKLREATAPAVPGNDASEVSRAFAAIAMPDMRAGGDTRRELERRVREGAPLAGLQLTGAKLDGAKLPRAILAGIDLSEADLSMADLTGADLSGAKLDGTKLDGAKLDAASLAGATLEFASLRSASLMRANLSGASFPGADLRDADLRGAYPDSALMGADLTGARR